MNISIIVLGGSGKRLGADVPKQFLLKNNKKLYLYTVDKFIINPHIESIILVIHPDYIDEVQQELADLDYFSKKDIYLVAGGNARFNSVFNGLTKIKEIYCDTSNINVLIHDGVRCNVSQNIIDKNIEVLSSFPCALTAIKGEKQGNRIDTCHVINDVSYLAQTPQSFKFDYLYNKYSAYIARPNRIIFDDVSLVENVNEIAIIEGEESNYKITRIEDYERFCNEQDKKEYDIYLFDFDGTLVDSHESLYLVYKEGFKKCGIEIEVSECQTFMKETIDLTFKRKNADPKYFKEYCETINSFINDESVTKANKLFSDTKELLENLYAHKKCLAIVTSNDKEHTKDVLKFLKINPDIFSTIIGHAEVSRFKPDPEGILLGLKCLNYNTIQKACYVGDSKMDALASINAGIDGFIVSRNNNKFDELDNRVTKIVSLRDLKL